MLYLGHVMASTIESVYKMDAQTEALLSKAKLARYIWFAISNSDLVLRSSLDIPFEWTYVLFFV
jgi:hypothetical protein